jgi:hypothetical protein
LPVGAAHLHLEIGTGQLLGFPGSRGFAGAKANGDVFHPDRLARLESQVANDAVTLVEQSDDRNPLRHRRRARLVSGSAWNFDGDRFIALDLVILARALAR